MVTQIKAEYFNRKRNQQKESLGFINDFIEWIRSCFDFLMVGLLLTLLLSINPVNPVL
ncbi:MAG: hypothetical protein FD170_697 [Bacteroidetes bacterium]|nr:MAG: hypothetical protein FD170_697 [Bacteroidota bacterium]